MKASPILISLLLLTAIACAQPPTAKTLNIIPTSPNAASLGKFGEIPVGTYTGVPEINIPVYNITQGELNHNIGISYHAVGIKVEEIASWVGLGWALQANGTITRTFRGLPDETQSFFNPANDPANPSDQYLTDIANGDKDGESDLYTFSTGKLSGSFFYDHSGVIHAMPLSNLKINKTTTGWTITDIEGVQYFFDVKEFTHVVKFCYSGSANSSPQIFNDYPTAWNLSLIVSADKIDSIRFEYTPFNTQFTLSPVQTRNQLVWANGPCVASDDICTSTNFVNAQRLTKISWKSGYIIFTANTTREDLLTDKRLDYIDIFNANGTLHKRNHLYYSYYQSYFSCDVPENLKRLKLDSIAEETATKALPAHSFVYNTQPLPCRSSFAIDAWGYYNGVTSNTGLIPTYSYPLSDGGYGIYPGADRKVDPAYTQTGILQKIKYPTGGTTSFEYENNVIWKEGEYPNTVSVEVLVSLQPPQQNYIRNFSINIPPGAWNLNMGGVVATISANKTVDNLGSRTTANAYLYKLDGNNNIISTFVIDDGYLTDHHLENGNYRLEVQLPFPISAGNSNLNPAFHVAINWQQPDISNSHFLVGGLRVKKVFDATKNGESINVREFKYTYANNRSTGSMLAGLDYQFGTSILKRKDEMPDAPIVSFHRCDYVVRQEYSRLPLTQASGPYVGYQLVTVTEPGKGYVTFEYTTPASHPDEVITQFPFAPSISHSWQRGLLLRECNFKEGASLPSRIKRNIYASLLPGLYSVNLVAGYDNFSEGPGQPPPPKRTVYGNFSDFQYLKTEIDTTFDQNDATKYIITKTEYEYKQPAFQLAKLSTLNSRGQSIVTAYKYPDDYDNSAMQGNIAALKDKNIIAPIVYKSTSKNNLILDAEAYNYNIDGKLLETYKLEINEPLTPPAFNPLNTIPDPALFKLYQTQFYNPLYKKISEITKNDQTPIVYMWGYNACFPVAKIEGSSYSTVSQLVSQNILNNPASDQQLQTELNKIRTALAGTNGLVTTYTYNPLVGMTTQTDPANRTTFYEYDTFNRLKLIKDQNGKILKKICYNYTGQQSPCTE